MALLALPFLYLLGVLLGAVIPANSGWKEAERGVTIFIRTNGVHTWVMVPTVASGVDWRPMIEASHIKDPLQAGNHLAFGYGNRDFYLNTPTWSDLSLGTALSAALGAGPSLMHVDHETDPRLSEYERPLTLTPGEYRRLANFIRASFQRDLTGRTIPLPGRGYDSSDAFYEAQGPYNLLFTCNEWTGAALRAAGVETGFWTPLAQSVMWRMKPAPAEPGA